MKKLTLREIQLEELEMLKIFIKICEKNKIKYYLMGGTLLGAIRHKGFIPWDDDIDLFVPRPDYDKLYKLIFNDKIKFDNNYEFSSSVLGNGPSPYLKLVNKNILIKEKASIDNNLWIDIFPMDGLPEDEKEIKIFLKKSFARTQFYNVKLMKFKNVLKSSKTLKRRIIKILIKPFMIFINKDRFVSNHVRLSSKYNYNNSKYVANVIWVDQNQRYYEKSKLEEQALYKFEDIEAKSFKNYEEYLVPNYGDYMKLPPESKRYTHSFDAYKIDGNSRE